MESVYSGHALGIPASPLIPSAAGTSTDDQSEVIKALQQIVKEQDQRIKKLEETIQAFQEATGKRYPLAQRSDWERQWEDMTKVEPFSPFSGFGFDR